MPRVAIIDTALNKIIVPEHDLADIKYKLLMHIVTGKNLFYTVRSRKDGNGKEILLDVQKKIWNDVTGKSGRYFPPIVINIKKGTEKIEIPIKKMFHLTQEKSMHKNHNIYVSNIVSDQDYVPPKDVELKDVWVLGTPFLEDYLTIFKPV